MGELIRVAFSPDPSQPPTRPRRATVSIRVALGLGLTLLLAAVVIAAHTAWTSHAKTSVSVLDTSAGGEKDNTGMTRDPPLSSEEMSSALEPVDPASALAMPPGDRETLVVHVAGAVTNPGVVTVPAGARVADALDHAGGPLEDADTDQLNLARPLVDGEQVRVPHRGEDISTWMVDTHTDGGRSQPSGMTGDNGSVSQGGAKRTGEVGGQVNINTADAVALDSLPGIGPALADRIVAYRNEHGPFTCVEDLRNVPGIGEAKLRDLRERAVL